MRPLHPFLQRSDGVDDASKANDVHGPIDDTSIGQNRQLKDTAVA